MTENVGGVSGGSSVPQNNQPEWKKKILEDDSLKSLFDLDGDGKLDATEMEKANKNLGLFDTNQDGDINQTEKSVLNEYLDKLNELKDAKQNVQNATANVMEKGNVAKDAVAKAEAYEAKTETMKQKANVAKHKSEVILKREQLIKDVLNGGKDDEVLQTISDLSDEDFKTMFNDVSPDFIEKLDDAMHDGLDSDEIMAKILERQQEIAQKDGKTVDVKDKDFKEAYKELATALGGETHDYGEKAAAAKDAVKGKTVKKWGGHDHDGSHYDFSSTKKADGEKAAEEAFNKAVKEEADFAQAKVDWRGEQQQEYNNKAEDAKNEVKKALDSKKAAEQAQTRAEKDSADILKQAEYAQKAETARQEAEAKAKAEAEAKAKAEAEKKADYEKYKDDPRVLKSIETHTGVQNAKETLKQAEENLKRHEKRLEATDSGDNQRRQTIKKQIKDAEIDAQRARKKLEELTGKVREAAIKIAKAEDAKKQSERPVKQTFPLQDSPNATGIAAEAPSENKSANVDESKTEEPKTEEPKFTFPDSSHASGPQVHTFIEGLRRDKEVRKELTLKHNTDSLADNSISTDIKNIYKSAINGDSVPDDDVVRLIMSIEYPQNEHPKGVQKMTCSKKYNPTDHTYTVQQDNGTIITINEKDRTRIINIKKPDGTESSVTLKRTFLSAFTDNLSTTFNGSDGFEKIVAKSEKPAEKTKTEQAKPQLTAEQIDAKINELKAKLKEEQDKLESSLPDMKRTLADARIKGYNAEIAELEKQKANIKE